MNDYKNYKLKDWILEIPIDPSKFNYCGMDIKNTNNPRAGSIFRIINMKFMYGVNPSIGMFTGQVNIESYVSNS